MERLNIRLFGLLCTLNIGALASPLNESLHLVLPNTNNDYDFQCDGPRYGTFSDWEVSGCLEAKKAIAAGRERIMFAMRDTPEMTGDAYPLPWRWMDGRSTPPGCSMT